jgi:hypothetical protein
MIVVSFGLSSIDEVKTGIQEEQSWQAYNFSNLCAEDALMKLRRDIDYAGDQTLIFESGDCYIFPVEGLGNNDRIIKTRGTSGNQIKKDEIWISQVNPSPELLYWKQSSGSSRTTELLTSASQSSWTSSYAPYRTYYEDSIAQSIYLKSDLEETGISGPVEITEVCLYCSETPGRDIANMRIKMKNTAASSLSSFDTSGLTVVYGPASYVKPVAGEWKCHTLDTPFTWDGTGNLLVESYRNDDDWTSGGGNYVRNTGSGRTYAGYCDSCSGCGPGQDCYSPSQRRSFSYVMSIKLTYIPQD